MDALGNIVVSIAILAFFFGLTFDREIAGYINAKAEGIHIKNHSLNDNALKEAYQEGYNKGYKDGLRNRSMRRKEKETC